MLSRGSVLAGVRSVMWALSDMYISKRWIKMPLLSLSDSGKEVVSIPIWRVGIEDAEGRAEAL